MIKVSRLLLIVTSALLGAGCVGTNPLSDSVDRCTEAWERSIEDSVPTGDGQGHGPDIGSDEWKSVVEFKLGIRGEPATPPRDSPAWCDHIDQVVHGSVAASALGEAGPSFSCDAVAADSIEAMICKDTALSALDRMLAGIYVAAASKAAAEQPPVLQAEQRGWIKGRNECWKDADTRECVRNEYIRRNAELQARYRLVPYNGPARFICDGNPANEVVVMFYQTEPLTLIAEYGDSVALMYIQPSASGTRYQGRNEAFWEHQGEAMITWGYNTPPMHCTKAP